MDRSVRPLVLRMDPRSDAFDERILRVTERIRSVRVRTRTLSERIADLTRPFLEHDLVHQSGDQQGQRLAKRDRVEWLSTLAGLHRAYCSAGEEEAQLQALLRRIQDSAEGSSTRQGGVPPSGPVATQPPA